MVECGVCGKEVLQEECRGIYVEARGVHYVCSTCRMLPFDRVMDALASGKVYKRDEKDE